MIASAGVLHFLFVCAYTRYAHNFLRHAKISERNQLLVIFSKQVSMSTDNTN